MTDKPLEEITIGLSDAEKDDWEEMIKAFKEKKFDLLVADLRLPDIDGMEVIKEVKEAKPETEVIVITGYGTTATAVEAMKIGALDYLIKPFDPDGLVVEKLGFVHDRVGEHTERVRFYSATA